MMVTRNRNRSFSRILVVAIALMLAVGLFCGTGAAATNMDWTSYSGSTTGDITITDASGSTLSHKTTLTISQDAVLDFGDAKTYALTGSTSTDGCGGLVDNLRFSDASKVLTIKNLHITSSGVINSLSNGIGGLFGRIESNGKLILENCSINGVTIIGSSSNVGGLVGSASSAGLKIKMKNCTIENCNISSDSGCVGGLVGSIYGAFDDTGFTSLNMSGCNIVFSNISSDDEYVGGLVGWASSASLNMSGCLVMFSNVTSFSRHVGGLISYAIDTNLSMGGCKIAFSNISSGSSDVGGLVGTAGSVSFSPVNLSLSGCIVDSVYVSGSSYVGGLVGHVALASLLNMSGCKIAFSNISSRSYYVGGLVGHVALASLNLSGCIVDRVYVSGGNYAVGGLVGYAESTWAAFASKVNCVNTIVNGSEVKSGSGSVGGLVGYADDATSLNLRGLMVENSKIWSSSSGAVGGLVGNAESASLNLSGWIVDECTVWSSDSCAVGGLVGWADSTSIAFIDDGCWVNNSWISGISDIGTSDIGSLVGYSSSTLSPLVAPQHSAVYSASTTIGSSAIANNDFDGIGTKEQYGSPIDRYGLVAGKDYGYISYKPGVVASGTCGDNLTWVLSDDGTLTISGTGAMYDYSYKNAPWYQYRSQMIKLVLPDGLTTIGDFAFDSCSTFTGSLTIPNSVTSIGDSAFYGCSGFTGSLIIPNNVTTIGYCAFEYCNGFTGSLTIPNSVTTIDSSAFQSCSGFNGALTLLNNLTTIGDCAFSRCSGFIGTLVIPNGVTTIGDFAFDSCSNFTGSLTIPNSVMTIGRNPFSYCNNISAITVESANPNYSSDSQGILYNKNWSSIISCPAGKTGTLTISDSVTTIGDYAFYGCSGLTGSLTIPNNVTTIGYCAFEYCNGFTGSLTLPNSITTICGGAFYGCSGFTGSLTIPSSITTIGAHVFSGCSGITTVTLLSSVTSIGYDAFKALHANSVIYAECPASLVSGNYSTDRTALAANGTDKAYTFTVNASSFPSGFPLTSDNAPVKENYTFAGWYTTPSYSGSAVSTVTDGQTLYAKWIDGDAGFHLYAGWNVVSTPKKLSSAYDTAAELFAGVNTTGHAILSYNSSTKSWEQVTASTKIELLNAYWIYSNASKNLPYEFSSTVSSPASKSVYAGWNAVSLSADEPMSAAEAFGNINWYTYLEWNAASQAFKSALIKGGSGEHADTNLVSLWTGGWLFLNEDGTYMGFTA